MPKPRHLAGTKRQRVTFERLDSGLDAFRQPVTTWSPVKTVFAEVRSLAGRELMTAQQVRPETTLRVTIRGRELEVTSDMRIDFNGRRLAILAAYDPEEEGRETLIDCAEWKDAD
jgi:SPP1 family predicted phage head-tail adaptor